MEPPGLSFSFKFCFWIIQLHIFNLRLPLTFSRFIPAFKLIIIQVSILREFLHIMHIVNTPKCSKF